MKEVLVHTDGKINWKSMGVFLLGSIATTVLTLVANYKELFLNPHFNFPLIARAGFITNYLFFYSVMLVAWAWLLHIRPLFRNRIVNLVAAALLISVIVVVCRENISRSVYKGAVPVFDQQYVTGFLITLIPYVMGSFVTILFCELFTTRIKNKISLFFLAQGVGALVIAVYSILFPGEYRFHPFSFIHDCMQLVLEGFLTAFFMRLARVNYFFGELSASAVLKRKIIEGLNSGRTKGELWNEMLPVATGLRPSKLARLFASVTPDANDFKSLRAQQCFLIIYSFLTLPNALHGLSPLREHSFDSNGFIRIDVEHLILIPSLLIIFIKLFLLYHYAHHRAFAYRLTIGLALVLGIISLLLGIKGGWEYIVSGVIHFIAALVAAKICSYAYFNYRLFRVLKGDDGTYKL